MTFFPRYFDFPWRNLYTSNIGYYHNITFTSQRLKHNSTICVILYQYSLILNLRKVLKYNVFKSYDDFEYYFQNTVCVLLLVEVIKLNNLKLH